MLALKTIDTSSSINFSKQPKFTKISCSSATSLDMRNKNKTDFYKVLSLESETVGFAEIRKAYRSLALQYHPDVTSPSKREESTKMFVELHRAYETLSNPELRKRYDLQLRMKESGGISACSELSREIWEDQLRGLVRRSERREREKAGFWRK